MDPLVCDLRMKPQKSLKGSYHCVPSKRRWPSSVRRRIANPVTLWSRGFKSPPSRHFSIQILEFSGQFWVFAPEPPGHASAIKPLCPTLRGNNGKVLVGAVRRRITINLLLSFFLNCLILLAFHKALAIGIFRNLVIINMLM